MKNKKLTPTYNKIDHDYAYIKKVIANPRNTKKHIPALTHMLNNFVEKFKGWIYAECLAILLEGDIALMKVKLNSKIKKNGKFKNC